MNINIAIILVVLLFFVLIKLYEFFTYDQTIIYYDFGNPSSNIRITIMAGVHGNEPAGSILLNEILKTNYFTTIAETKNIFIRVLPVCNNVGFYYGIRFQNNLLRPDINRNFVGNGLDRTSRTIIELTKNSNYILDFHEAWGYYKINPSSIGSTLTPSNNMRDIAEIIKNKLNEKIKNDKYKFELRKKNDICSIKSAFSCFNNKLNKNYILIETTGQNNKQPLKIRKDQIFTVINTFLSHI